MPGIGWRLPVSKPYVRPEEQRWWAKAARSRQRSRPANRATEPFQGALIGSLSRKFRPATGNSKVTVSTVTGVARFRAITAVSMISLTVNDPPVPARELSPLEGKRKANTWSAPKERMPATTSLLCCSVSLVSIWWRARDCPRLCSQRTKQFSVECQPATNAFGSRRSRRN